MNKRNLATILWFAAGWTAGAMFAAFTGVSSIVALPTALIAAGLVRWDPTRSLWHRRYDARHVVKPDELSSRGYFAGDATASRPRP